MAKVNIRYECPCCGALYDTKEEAENCQYPEGEKTFAVGSIVTKGVFLNHPKEITWISDDGGLPGVSAKPSMDWYHATNRRPDFTKDAGFRKRPRCEWLETLYVLRSLQLWSGQMWRRQLKKVRWRDGTQI